VLLSYCFSNCTAVALFFSIQFFVSQLDYKFKHEREKEESGKTNNIEDIIDGKNYKGFFGEEGFLRNRYYLAFQMNTDGVALFKSSTFSIWPVYMIICIRTSMRSNSVIHYAYINFATHAQFGANATKGV